MLWRVLAIIAAFSVALCAHSEASRLDHLRNALTTADRNNVMVAAHRACWKEGAPENSISAIVACETLGIDIAEIDVHLTRDGVPVLLHDPTLEEALRAARGRILVNLDVKAEAFDAAFAVVRRLGVDGQILMKMNVHADDPALAHATFLGKALFMPIIRQCNASVVAAACVQSLREEIPTFARYSPVAYEVVFSSTDFLEKLAGDAGGRRIWVNALNPDLAAGITDEKALEDPDGNWGRLLALGASIIQTDEPRKLIDYLRIHGKRSSE